MDIVDLCLNIGIRFCITWLVLTNYEKQSAKTILNLTKQATLTKILKFYVPTNSEHKLHKARIKNWLPIEFKLGFSLLRICRHNHQLETLTGSPTTENPKLNCWNCASVTKSHSWYLHPIEQKLNTIGLIIYKYATNTKFCYLPNNKTEGKLPTPGATQGNLDLTFPPYIPLIDNRNKKIKA